MVHKTGNSTVWRAVSPTGHSVAIKEVGFHASSPSLRASLIEYEAEALRRCDHPHVIRLIDTHGDGADRKLMLEWVDGYSLARFRTKSLATAIRVFRQIGEGVAAIHKGGFLHSDLHPKNVLFDPRKRKAIVIDLGFAYPLLEKAGAGINGGTAKYIAPERLVGSSADVRSDIYGLGAVLYYLVKGDHAFTMEDAVRFACKSRPPKILCVPNRVNTVIQKACAFEPSDRFRTVDEMLAALPERAR